MTAPSALTTDPGETTVAARLSPSTRLTPVGGALAAVTAVAAVAAVALRLPAAVALLAPALLVLVVDALWFTPTDLDVRLDLDAARVLEGGTVRLEATMRAARRDMVAVSLATGRRLAVTSGAGWRAAPVLPSGAITAFELVAGRWGAATVGPLTVRWSAPFGSLRAEATTPVGLTVRVHPAPATVRELVRPRETLPWAGNQPADRVGVGLEFAEVRRFVPGDRLRDVNWRASARHGDLWVNARHPERTADVVLLLDAYEPEWIDRVVRLGVTLTEAHLDDGDRVGVVGLGGLLRWIPPGGGDRHRRRLVDTLIETQAVASWTRPAVDGVAPLALPPGALVVAVTPLGPDLAATLVDLRARGRDLLVLDVGGAAPGGPTPDGASTLDDLARRLARLERRARGDRLRSLGVVVVPVAADSDLDEVLLLAAQSRRRLRRRG